MIPPRLWLSLALLGGFALVAAQPPQPPAPAKYDVKLRYHITSARDQHVALYDALINHLKSLDFAFNPPLENRPNTDREDRSLNILEGKIAPGNFLKIMENPSVAAVMVVPDGFALPEELDKPVRVRLELAGGLAVDRQRALAEQVRALLDTMKFREAIGYDHHGYRKLPFTRLVGTIPRGRLDDLLKDLRLQPAGWFAPRVSPKEIPLPLRAVHPIRIIEVLPDAGKITDVPRPDDREPDFLEKISPDLWVLVNDKNLVDRRLRVQLVLTGSLNDESADWRGMLREKAPGMFIVGQLGQVVTGLVNLSQVKALASLPQISVVRWPGDARVDTDPASKFPGDNAKALALTGLAGAHVKGYRGQGVRLALIDTDFRGWEKLVQEGKLPPKTRLVDLTAENSTDFVPFPFPSALGQIGHGTHCALAAALAAPDAELVLIRIAGLEPGLGEPRQGFHDPYQIDEVIRYFGGGPLSPLLDLRRDEVATLRARINFLRSQLLSERGKILELFIDETDLERDFGFLGPVYGWIFSDRALHRQRVLYVEEQEKLLKERTVKYFALADAIQSLKGIRLAACPLVWNDGFALGGSSHLSRAFDKSAKDPLLWFQATGNTRGQTWTGLFRDDNGNGIMEFVPPDYPRKKDRWTSELNFLAWQPFTGKQTAELPEGTRLRIAIQWREPHDPDYFARPGEEDVYRKPLADLRLALLYQRDSAADPKDRKLPADAFEVAARSFGLPQRLEHLPGGSIYEVVLETTLAKTGRYALQVARPVGFQWFLEMDALGTRPKYAQVPSQLPTGLRPLGVATLPAQEKNWELQPRLFVDVVGPKRTQARAVFADDATDSGSVGLPADARTVISVGAADWEGRPRPYSAGGALAFAELARRPTVLAFDALAFENRGGAYGTSLATSFAAGLAATVLSSGASADNLLKQLHLQNGSLLKIAGK